MLLRQEAYYKLKYNLNGWKRYMFLKIQYKYIKKDYTEINS